MAILSVDEHWKDRRIVEALDGGNSGTRLFHVITDDPATSEAAILAHDSIPILGSSFPGSDSVKCHQRSVTREPEQRIEFWVVCDYKSILSRDEEETAQNPNPLDRAAKIEWTSQRILKPMRRLLLSEYYSTFTNSVNDTFNLELAANSASDPFEPVLEYEFSEDVAVITKNVDSIPQWFFDGYKNAVNDADIVLDFYGQPRTIKKGCGRLSLSRLPISKTENGIEYVKLSFDIVVRQQRELREGETVAPEPWDDEIPDAGMRVISLAVEGGDINQIWTQILDTNGIAINLPVPFDGQGQPISTAGTPIIETAMKYRLARPYPRKDFSILPGITAATP